MITVKSLEKLRKVSNCDQSGRLLETYYSVEKKVRTQNGTQSLVGGLSVLTILATFGPSRPPRFPTPNLWKRGREKQMSIWAILFVVLLIAWLGGFTVFHVAGGLIHLLLVFAVISLILHFVMGRRTT